MVRPGDDRGRADAVEEQPEQEQPDMGNMPMEHHQHEMEGMEHSMSTLPGPPELQFSHAREGSGRAGYKSSPQDEHLGAPLVKRCVGSCDGAHRARGLHGPP